MNQIIITYGNRTFDLSELLVNLYVKPAVLLMIYYGFFARQQGLLGIGGGMLTAILSFGLFAYCAYHFLFIKKQQRLSQLATLISAFFVLIALTPFLSAFIFDGDPKAIFRYSFEIAVAFFLFFSIYYVIRSKIITPRFFIYAIAILGFIAAFQVIFNLFGISQLRRLSIGLGSVNYTANSFTICLIGWIAIIYKNYIFEQPSRTKLLIYILLAFLVFIVVFLSGTRSAAIAFLFGIVFFQYFGMKSKKVNRIIVYILILFILFFIYLSTKIDLTFFLDRFTTEQIKRMALIRFNQYAISVTDLTLWEFLIGRPDLYTFSDSSSGTRFINTHNFILSLIRYNGILPFILLIVLGITIIYTYLKNFTIRKVNKRLRLSEATIIVFLVIVFIYAMFSGGRLTRMFSFYMVAGYAIGYFDLMKTELYRKNQKKFIL